jgi:hypothetical protein
VICLPYVNACGAGVFCDSGKFCVNGACMASAASIAAAANASALLPRPAGIVPPLFACAAARLAQRGCGGDATPLLRTSGAKLGYAIASDNTECYHSSAFKCCAIASTNPAAPAIAHIAASCKGSILFESAVSGIVNTTVNLIQAVATNAGAASAVASNASAAGGNASGLPSVEPVFQPVFQTLADAVTGYSQRLLAPLNVTLNGSQTAAATAKTSQSPPPGYVINGAGGVGVPTALAGALLLALMVLNPA